MEASPRLITPCIEVLGPCMHHIDSPILVANVGGTNQNLALMAPEGMRYRLLALGGFDPRKSLLMIDPTI